MGCRIFNGDQVSPNPQCARQILASVYKPSIHACFKQIMHINAAAATRSAIP
jgi:hypothetical protein